jgi:GTPase
MDLRNIAIIAHVDHGKTTLVDVLLRQSGSHLINAGGKRFRPMLVVLGASFGRGVTAPWSATLSRRKVPVEPLPRPGGVDARPPIDG